MRVWRWGLAIVVALYGLYFHNPQTWNASVEGKAPAHLASIFGEPDFSCAEPGLCYIWVSGYRIFGVYLFPTLMIIDYDDGRPEKTFVPLPIYNVDWHKKLSESLDLEG